MVRFPFIGKCNLLIALPAFFDESIRIKLNDFVLSRALLYNHFTNACVGVRLSYTIHPPLLQGYSRSTDAIMHVPRAHPKQSVRLEMGHLAAGLPCL